MRETIFILCLRFYLVLEVASGERGDISNLVKLAAEIPDKENNQEKTPDEETCKNKNKIFAICSKTLFFAAYMLPALEVERNTKFTRCNPFKCGAKGPQAPGPVCNVAQQFWILFQRALLVTFKDLV